MLAYRKSIAALAVTVGLVGAPGVGWGAEAAPAKATLKLGEAGLTLDPVDLATGVIEIEVREGSNATFVEFGPWSCWSANGWRGGAECPGQCRWPVHDGVARIERASHERGCTQVFREGASIDYAIVADGSCAPQQVRVAIPFGASCKESIKVDVTTSDGTCTARVGAPQSAARGPAFLLAADAAWWESSWDKVVPVLRAKLCATPSQTASVHYIGDGNQLCQVDYERKVVAPPPDDKVDGKWATEGFEKACAEYATDRKRGGANWAYVFCVDFLTSPADPRHIVRSTAGRGSVVEWPHGLEANRDLLVAVWYRPTDHEPIITLSGNPGRLSEVVGEKSSAAATLLQRVEALFGFSPEYPDRKRKTQTFVPRDTQYPVLEITFKGKKAGSDDVERKYPFELSLRRLYRGALRVGVGALWTPAERQYSLVGSDADPAGKQIVGLKAGKGGAGTLDLVVGYSYFLAAIDEGMDSKGIGLFAGLGLAGVGTNGFKAFDSILGGVDVMLFGPDYSMTFVVGLRRVDALADGYAEGMWISKAYAKVPVASALTPTVGVIFNFAPSFWTAAGGRQ